ncbi:hypothetical protein C8R44DRAFT_777519 [Mycena epipterygia]|nr:hypothetical protein C8R44DRAFT_777519 [Mycena epipterygia]
MNQNSEGCMRYLIVASMKSGVETAGRVSALILVTFDITMLPWSSEPFSFAVLSSSFFFSAAFPLLSRSSKMYSMSLGGIGATTWAQRASESTILSSSSGVYA